MKNKIYLLLVLCLYCCQLAMAQGYRPFPDSNAVWSVARDKYALKGDSIYNGKTYNKCFQKLDTVFYPNVWNYLGMIRQDKPNKLVLGIKKNKTQERLIYKFKLQIGDTFTVYPFLFTTWWTDSLKLTVVAKDSLYQNSQYYRTWLLRSTVLGVSLEQWIEGVGSEVGPFAGGTFAFDGVGSADYYPCPPALLCLQTGTVMIYQNQLYNFCFGSAKVYNPCPTSIREQKGNLDGINLFPNPTQNRLTLLLPNKGWNKLEFRIENMLGIEVLHSSIQSPQTEIPTEDLSTGIYYLTIWENGKKLGSIKFAKVP